MQRCECAGRGCARVRASRGVEVQEGAWVGGARAEVCRGVREAFEGEARRGSHVAVELLLLGPGGGDHETVLEQRQLVRVGLRVGGLSQRRGAATMRPLSTGRRTSAAPKASVKKPPSCDATASSAARA